MSCVDKEESKITKTTKVQTVDIWVAIDALDALPETHNTDWYKRLVEAAEAATQAELIAKGRIETH
jgi:hypothetical protein